MFAAAPGGRFCPVALKVMGHEPGCFLWPWVLTLYVSSQLDICWCHTGTSKSATVGAFATNQGLPPPPNRPCHQEPAWGHATSLGQPAAFLPLHGPETWATEWKVEPKDRGPSPESSWTWSWTCLYSFWLIKLIFCLGPFGLYFLSLTPERWLIKILYAIRNKQMVVYSLLQTWIVLHCLTWHPRFPTVWLRCLFLASEESILCSRLIGLLNRFQQSLLPALLCAFVLSVPSATLLCLPLSEKISWTS